MHPIRLQDRLRSIATGLERASKPAPVKAHTRRRVSLRAPGISAATPRSARSLRGFYSRYEIDDISDDEVALTAPLDARSWSASKTISGYPIHGGLPVPGETEDADDPYVARGSGSDLGLWVDYANTPPVNDGLSEPVVALCGQDWTLEPYPLPKDASARERELAAKHYQYGLRVLRAWGDDAITQLVEELVYWPRVAGFGLWELTTQRRRLAFGIFAEELFIPEPPRWISPSAVEYWLSTHEDLFGVLFDFSSSSDYFGGVKGRVAVPYHKLVHVRWRGYGAGWEGSSAIRPAYQPVGMWREMYQLQALSAEIAGVGWPVATMGEGASKSDVDATIDHLNDFTARVVPYLALPPGWSFDWHSPQGMVARFVDILNMYKADIAATLGNDASLTGVIHSGGSFALQQEKEAKERRGYRWLVKKLVSGPFSAQIMRPMLALNFPDDEELFAPRLTPGDVTAKDVSKWTTSLLSAAAATGPTGEPLLYDPGPIGKAIRREHGLPEDLDAVEKGAEPDGAEEEPDDIDEELVDELDAAKAEDDDEGPLVPVVPLASSAPLMTVKETAQYLRASPSTIRKWSKSGALPIAGQKGKKGGYLYRIEDLVEWLQAPSSSQDDDDADAIDTQGAAL